MVKGQQHRICGDVARRAGDILVDVEGDLSGLEHKALHWVMNSALAMNSASSQRRRCGPSQAIGGGGDGDASFELVHERVEREQ